MKARLTIEIDIDKSFFGDDEQEDKLFLENKILVGNGTLELHSDEVGDVVGFITKVSNIEYLTK